LGKFGGKFDGSIHHEINQEIDLKGRQIKRTGFHRSKGLEEMGEGGCRRF